VRLKPVELPRKPTTFSAEEEFSLKTTVRVLVALSMFRPWKPESDDMLSIWLRMVSYWAASFDCTLVSLVERADCAIPFAAWIRPVIAVIPALAAPTVWTALDMPSLRSARSLAR